jgi:RNA polymerase sigma-70 factor (ECF subfamily)
MKGGVTLNDKLLIKLLRNDPAEGLNEAVNTYSGLLTAVVMRVLKNPQEAEECVADTFISLWKNIHTLKKIENLKAYLLCIARNNAIDRYRKLKNQALVSIDNIDGFEIIADDDVELLIIKNEFMSELQKFIMKLPEPGREIFIRKYFLFEPVKEIAGKLNLNEVQVKDRLYRIRKQIQNNFKKRGISYEEIIFTTAR